MDGPSRFLLLPPSSYILLVNFVNAVAALPAGTSFAAPLKSLCDLFALTQIEADIGSFLEDGFISSRQAAFVRSQARELLQMLRYAPFLQMDAATSPIWLTRRQSYRFGCSLPSPNAVALTDAFQFGDYMLNSSLGRYDGDIYRDMYRRAQQEPLNKNQVPPGYEEYLRPYLTAKL